MPTDPPSADSSFIAITGASGLIGRALLARLRLNGKRVRRLVRSPDPESSDDIVWDPMRGTLDPRQLEGAEAVVNLAGELLARTIATLDRKPTALLSGSAVGYYGDRGDDAVDEESAPGTDFLADVARAWETAAEAAGSAGVRVVLLRTGIVLSPRGGALERLLPPFRLGVGGPIGTGRQWMSWIALEDHVRAMEHALLTVGLHGAVNLVAPNAVTNAEFATTLGRVLGRPAIVPVPSFALELLYGEMARATILAGQRVLPRKLLRSGFHFAHPTLEDALQFELAR
jgi:uncharacterized protein (TIGR01777 family)